MYLLNSCRGRGSEPGPGGTVGSDAGSSCPCGVYSQWGTDQYRDSLIVRRRECCEMGSIAAKGGRRRVSQASFVEVSGKASWKK